MILECPRCLALRNWNRVAKPAGPGLCPCRTLLPWKLLKLYAKPKRIVIVNVQRETSQ